MRDFQNKTYWIVGASEGLGRALALQLANMGAQVIISARNEERLLELAEEIGLNSSVLPMDVTDESSVRKAFSKLPKTLDGFVFLSGVYWHINASSWDIEKAEEMVDVNLVGAMRCLGHLVPKFTSQGFGHIVLTGSKQDYDLQGLWAEVSESGKRIEVQRVFNHPPAAVSRFYDPYAGSFDQRQLLDAFGFGNVSPAISFVLKPISYDLARANAIETSDLVRKSAYSFEIHNNKLRIFLFS